MIIYSKVRVKKYKHTGHVNERFSKIRIRKDFFQILDQNDTDP